MIYFTIFVQRCIPLMFLLSLTVSQESEPPRPTFPNVFQVEIQGVFQDEMRELDGSLYYDRLKNKAALTYTYQNETTTSIYDFNKNQLIYILGVECSVSEIKQNNFIPFDIDEKTGRKIIASPERIFYFTKSKFNGQELTILPSYVYSAIIDIPEYGFKNCDVMHIFSKPELELPDCESHNCRSTLLSISVKCPPIESQEESTQVIHTYNFYRFRSAISDYSVFQPPVGVHCDAATQKPFPQFPSYFSFSYELIEEQIDYTGNFDPGVYTVNKKVWYDSKLRLIRMDEFDDDGLMLSSRIFDFYGQTAYTIVASVPICEAGLLFQNIALDEVTRLPKIFFPKNPEDKNSAVYIGKRSVHGLIYEVWTLSFIDEETEAKVVQEFYFTNIIYKNVNESQINYLQLSHVDMYTYEKTYSGNYELQVLSYLSISNFRSKPKEWEAFDVSSCFSGEKKKGFTLKVSGPAIVKKSLLYEELLENLYMKLIIHSNASLIRISQLKGRFDGIYISEFTGWILTKIEHEGVTSNEPGIEEAYNSIERAADIGKLNIKVKKDGKDQIYTVTAVVEHFTRPPSCYSGGTLAAMSLILLFMGITIGLVGYYVFLKKKLPRPSDKVELCPVIAD